jgi:hypothetical protein
MWVINRVMLSEPVFGAYTQLFAGLSFEAKVEDIGVYLIPRGRKLAYKPTPRQDLIRACRMAEEEGM